MLRSEVKLEEVFQSVKYILCDSERCKVQVVFIDFKQLLKVCTSEHLTVPINCCLTARCGL